MTPVIHHHDEATRHVGLDVAPPGLQQGKPLPVPPTRETRQAHSEVKELLRAYQTLEQDWKALIYGSGICYCSDIAPVVELENCRLRGDARFDVTGVVYRLFSNDDPDNAVQSKSRTLTQTMFGAEGMFVTGGGGKVLRGDVANLHEEGWRLDKIDAKILRGIRPYARGKLQIGEQEVDAEVRWGSEDGVPSKIGLMRTGVLPVPTLASI